MKVLQNSIMEDIPQECYYYECDHFKKKCKKGEREFPAIHLNIRSIKNKVQDFDIFLHTFSLTFTVIIVTETWLAEGNGPPYLQGCTCESISRKNKRGDGLSIHIKDNLPHKTRQHMQYGRIC